MKQQKRYQLAIFILSLVVIAQGIVIALVSRAPKKPPVRKVTAVVIPKLAPKVKGKIAIVLDDWGYNLNNLPAAEAIGYPLTISVLPNLNFSAKVAEELHGRGFEIILHLPMEPKEKLPLEKDTILSSMSAEEVRGILDKDLEAIPYVRGVSNHMGSKVTADPRLMQLVFEDLKKRKLYFLDSYVTAGSVCAKLAEKNKVRFIQRDVFLDNKLEPAYIKGQLFKLKAKAKTRGYAVGIGHDRKATLQVLKEVMPQLEKEGYKFVFVSELARGS